MAQRKRPGATAKRERQARAEARKNAPKPSKRQLLESALVTARQQLAGLDKEYSLKSEVKRLQQHVDHLESKLKALGEE